MGLVLGSAESRPTCFAGPVCFASGMSLRAMGLVLGSAESRLRASRAPADHGVVERERFVDEARSGDRRVAIDGNRRA